MSYQARRAPNVSAYLANLNTIPTANELAAQNDTLVLGADLGLEDFANTEFFDFDQFNPIDGDFAAQTLPEAAQQQQQPQQQQPLPSPQKAGSNGGASGNAGMAAGMGGYMTEFQTYPTPTTASTSTTNTLPSPTLLQGAYPPQPYHHQRPSTGVSSLPSAADLEEAARMAAEEDKRRRNTAASARFRVKKKAREAQLEKQAKEMTDKVTALESKVQALEMENRWLKGLIVEKAGGKGLLERETGRAKVAKAEEDKTSSEERTDGVGTGGEVEA
ncbi:hypothetical protein BAUCODRAFT_33466 [Baudoinia panamericana UAMH 10762]|uniref:BZIP domain-containing protein n=1 Tax=Baudoinia panamericana (strain UAMH 10762) TaxID=717646 RepID=M2NER2_BAUPA|nr:uncharacterized protein BAUCODRAFT_33466 [Baudoinia panamericana UAMH 10762]EMC97739.1 hypothetical protein BAUCODRAFT_33466 [Baudoinia panamericana UAMH 10762]